MEEKKQNTDSLDSLETLESTGTNSQTDTSETSKSHSSFSPISWVKARLNIYLALFIVVILASIGVTIFALSQDSSDSGSLSTQELTQEAVDNLINSETTIGDPKQILSVESNAVFAGKVLVRGGLDVAGTIQVGGDLSLPGITVSGTSALDQVQINDLAISGDTTIQGSLTIQDGLTVNGQTTFAGTLSVSDLELSGNLRLNSHIDAGGNTPSITTGSAVGSGGNTTISGTDTAGTVTVNVGSGASSGSLATVTFASSFSGTPHVVITPIGNITSGTHKFYLSNRTSTGFTIATTGGLPSGSISFDFIVID